MPARKIFLFRNISQETWNVVVQSLQQQLQAVDTNVRFTLQTSYYLNNAKNEKPTAQSDLLKIDVAESNAEACQFYILYQDKIVLETDDQFADILLEKLKRYDKPRVTLQIVGDIYELGEFVIRIGTIVQNGMKKAYTMDIEYKPAATQAENVIMAVMGSMLSSARKANPIPKQNVFSMDVQIAGTPKQQAMYQYAYLLKLSKILV